MNLIEFAVSLIAPHLCIVCAREGKVLCQRCAAHVLKPPPEVPAPPGVSTVWAATEYSGVAKELVAQLKFKRVKAASETISGWMDQQMPPLPQGIIVSYAPTANKRARQRGYDQARLIAKHFARRKGLRFQETLLRVTSTRQVGAKRQDRFQQLNAAFRARGAIEGKTILLIDDVMTTGATLQSCAWALKESGAQSVYAATFAYKR